VGCVDCRIPAFQPILAIGIGSLIIFLRHKKRLDRFTLRGQPKVHTQWTLYCLVHNIEKLARHGYAR
jgi:hypothetical protein